MANRSWQARLPPLFSSVPANPDFGSFSDARRLRRRPPVDIQEASGPVVPPETPYRLTSDGNSLPLYVTSMHPITVVHKLFGLPLK